MVKRDGYGTFIYIFAGMKRKVGQYYLLLCAISVAFFLTDGALGATLSFHHQTTQCANCHDAEDKSEDCASHHLDDNIAFYNFNFPGNGFLKINESIISYTVNFQNRDFSSVWQPPELS